MHCAARLTDTTCHNLGTSPFGTILPLGMLFYCSYSVLLVRALLNITIKWRMTVLPASLSVDIFTQ